MALDLSTAQSVAIGAASVNSAALAQGQYEVAAQGSACWVAVGSSPTAAAHAAGSTFIPQNYPVIVNVPRTGWFIAVIQDGAGTGFASITLNV